MTDVMEIFLDKNLEPEVKVYRIARDLMKMGSFHGNEPLWYAIQEMRLARNDKFQFDEKEEE